MTLHKLSAGTGYEYLTRQVAALDSTEKGATPLSDYYAAKGEAPGRWIGSGQVGIEGIEAGDAVSAEQMKRLFGTGAHPLTGQPLGSPYKVYGHDGVDGFNVEVSRRLGELVKIDGRSTTGETARVRSEVAREFFVREHDREPSSDRELSAVLARYSRPRQTAVAGYDLTFSPVKSVSALWAAAPGPVAQLVERAHDAAVADALAYVELEVLFTREGKDGARQVETRGLIATAFRHRDSRSGDPDLHTHVAVANKVQTRQGRWLSIYGRVLHQHVVAASETYNTALEHHLTAALGVRFVERPSGARDKRPVREIEGVGPDLVRAVVAAPGLDREAAARAGPRVHARPRPSAGAGRGAGARAAGEPRDPRGQARPAFRGRAAGDLGGGGDRTPRLPGRGRPDGRRGAASRATNRTPGLDAVGQGHGSPCAARAGVAPRHLAVLARVRRGPTPRPRRRRTRRPGRRGGGPLGGRRGRAPLYQPDPGPRPHRRAGSAAPLGRPERLPAHRQRPLHQRPHPRRRAAPHPRRRRHRRPVLRPRRRRAQHPRL